MVFDFSGNCEGLNKKIQTLTYSTYHVNSLRSLNLLIDLENI